METNSNWRRKESNCGDEKWRRIVIVWRRIVVLETKWRVVETNSSGGDEWRRKVAET